VFLTPIDHGLNDFAEGTAISRWLVFDQRRRVSEIPLKKIGEPEDVAKLGSYFCEEDATFITGAELIMDGGMTL